MHKNNGGEVNSNNNSQFLPVKPHARTAYDGFLEPLVFLGPREKHGVFWVLCGSSSYSSNVFYCLEFLWFICAIRFVCVCVWNLASDSVLFSFFSISVSVVRMLPIMIVKLNIVLSSYQDSGVFSDDKNVVN